MIRIAYQDGEHQYDEDYNPITTWNEKYCGWVINEEYEDEYIDWCNDSNGISEFPRGATEAEFKKLYPNAENYPIIMVRWFWDPDGWFKLCHEKTDKSENSIIKSWEYLDYSKDKAIEQLGRFCDFHKYAYNVKVYYNGEIIYDGKLD